MTLKEKHVSEEMREELHALRKALFDLHAACVLADNRENLSEEIDGSLLDAAANALELQYPVIWTAAQVDKLNAYQHGYGHPFTCGNDRSDEAHKAYAEEEDEDAGLLIATQRGWVCPVCDYRQFWAPEFMFKGVRPRPLSTLQEQTP